MCADRDIDALLVELGGGEPAVRKRARATLEEADLTRAGKKRISNEKLPRVREALAARFFVHCSSAACLATAMASGREPVLTEMKPAARAAAASTTGGPRRTWWQRAGAGG